MIAIYARQSLDKKDSISIESQIEYCKKELLDTDEYTIFRDKGFSGKNIDRPAFTKLLTSVKGEKVTKIVVYRLDRISRSITDFANIMDLLEAHKVDFVSASEKFDTSTPVGRAMLYIIMVFAQLERETIAQRIRDNYYSRGKTGVWLGGPAPFGYSNAKVTVGNKKIPTIEPNDDLGIVKEIFSLYSTTGAALGSIAKQLQGKHGGMWNNIKLARILHNPAYVQADADIYHFYASQKCIIVNDIEEFSGQKGCSLYGKRDRGSNKYRLTTDHVLSLALHDGVIDSQTWLRCQEKLTENRQIKNTGKGKHSWLTGYIKCGYCGYSMNVKVSKEIKYFTCTGRYITDLCLPERLSTHYVADVEGFVFGELSAYAERLEKRKIQKKDGNESERNLLKQRLYRVEEQIDALLEKLESANDTLMEYINKKILGLDEKKRGIQSLLGKSSVQAEDIQIPDLSEWESLDIERKRYIAQHLIEKVKVFNDKIEVVWKV